LVHALANVHRMGARLSEKANAMWGQTSAKPTQYKALAQLAQRLLIQN